MAFRVGKVRFRSVLAWLVVAVPITSWTVVSYWNVLYDDAFISFRYARNVGAGLGLVWNVGGAPTEGFTNLSLVLLLAPFLRLGADPLVMSRIFALVSLVVICVLLSVTSRRWLDLSPTGALLVGLSFAVVPSGQLLVLSGLETIIFSALALSSVLLGVALIVRGSLSLAVLFTTLSFFCYLTRPEGIFAVLAVTIGITSHWRRCGSKRYVISALTAFVGLVTFHEIWRIRTFDSFLPNPFFMKSKSFLLTSSGMGSVVGFLSTFAVGVMLALVVVILYSNPGSGELTGIPNPVRANYRQVLVVSSCAMTVVYLLFVLRTDTITDIGGRFAFPVLPFLFLIGAPAVGRIALLLESGRGFRAILPFLATIVGICIFASVPLGIFSTVVSPTFIRQSLSTMDRQVSENYQLRLANAFAKFGHVRPVMVAYADSGIVPYVSGLPWVDLAGLNDTFIAKESNQESAVNHVFDVRPDLFLIPRSHEGGLFRSGHGPLGDYEAWADDPRWADYAYVGTYFRPDTPYDLLILERTGLLTTAERKALSVDLTLRCVPEDSSLISSSNANYCN